MNPQVQMSREQVIAHLTTLIEQKELALTLYAKQREAKTLRREIALLDYKRRPDELDLGNRAEKVLQAEMLEFEASVANLDFMTSGVEKELKELKDMLKHANSGIIDPRQAGVVM